MQFYLSLSNKQLYHFQVLNMIKLLFIFCSWSSMSSIRFVFSVLSLQHLWKVYFKKSMKNPPASDLCDPLKVISYTQPQDSSCVDGIKLNVFHAPEEINPGNLHITISFIYYDWNVQLPKSLHYQVDNRVRNHLKSRGKKAFPPTSNKGNLEWPKEGASLSNLALLIFIPT